MQLFHKTVVRKCVLSMLMNHVNQLDFRALPIRAELLQALDAVNYKQMSAIQADSITHILEGRDLLAQAETGSGKTAAFALGLLNKLDSSLIETQALVICPTRELSEQVASEIRRLASALANTRVVTLCGGKSMHDQLSSLKRAPHIVVGTPGRLKKHLDKDSLALARLQTLVLDEADRMLDMGFYDDIISILSRTSKSRQTLLFSATYPDEIVKISRVIQAQPIEVRIKATQTIENIKQVIVAASEESKLESLLRVLGKYQPANALIFCNRKKTAQRLCEALASQGLLARALHGDLDQRERDEAVVLFANDSLPFLVATDVAARGLDINALSAVINYDLATDPDTHLHRIGRTGRAGLDGLAITLVTAGDAHRVRSIEEALNIEIPVIELMPSDRNDGLVSKPRRRTLLISAGKKDKLRPGDIVGALTAGSELSNDQLGKITVQSKVSFVAVDFDKGQTALKILAEGRIKRRKVKVRLL